MKIEKYKCDWCGAEFSEINDASQYVESSMKDAIGTLITSVKISFTRDLCVDCQRKALTQAAQQLEKAEGI
jgi:hypothetical protein